MTLKTGVIDAENSALQNIFKYKTVNLSYNKMSQYDCFTLFVTK